MWTVGDICGADAGGRDKQGLRLFDNSSRKTIPMVSCDCRDWLRDRSPDDSHCESGDVRNRKPPRVSWIDSP